MGNHLRLNLCCRNTSKRTTGFRIHQPRNLQCDDCEKKFSRIDSLNRHKKQTHGPQKDQNNASTCEQSSYFETLDYTETVNTDDNSDKIGENNNTKAPKKDTVIVCPQCGKTFSRTDSLKRHIIGVHENNKNTVGSLKTKHSSNVMTADEPYQHVLSFPESNSVVTNNMGKYNR